MESFKISNTILPLFRVQRHKQRLQKNASAKTPTASSLTQPTRHREKQLRDNHQDNTNFNRQSLTSIDSTTKPIQTPPPRKANGNLLIPVPRVEHRDHRLHPLPWSPRREHPLYDYFFHPLPPPDVLLLLLP